MERMSLLESIDDINKLLILNFILTLMALNHSGVTLKTD